MITTKWDSWYDLVEWDQWTKLPKELFDDIDRYTAEHRMYTRCVKLYERYEFRKVSERQKNLSEEELAELALKITKTWFRDNEQKIRKKEELLRKYDTIEIVDLILMSWALDDKYFIEWCAEIYMRD